MHLIPDIEEDIPLPISAGDALPDLSPKEELDMRARTIKMLSDITGIALIPSNENIAEAEVLAREMMSNPQVRPQYAKYPNEVMAYLAGMVAQTNVQLVDELSELKMYVVNKLIYEVEHAKDSKSRLTAIAKLGEVDGVDAFKKRSEMVVKIQPIEEVERELLSVLNNIEYTVIEPEDANYVVNHIPDNEGIETCEANE
ncbi:MAG: hypothetical protein WCO52_06105 [bacterium]